jgi:hypothetical protein
MHQTAEMARIVLGFTLSLSSYLRDCAQRTQCTWRDPDGSLEF